MDIKKIAQYGLLLLLIITSFLFYYQYFSNEDKTIESNLFEDVSEKKNTKENLNESKNIIENLKYISEDLDYDDNVKIAIITPDAEIVDKANINDPAYIVFQNYELILKWNRSLRFGLAVCTLKEKFRNEL